MEIYYVVEKFDRYADGVHTFYVDDAVYEKNSNYN